MGYYTLYQLTTFPEMDSETERKAFDKFKEIAEIAKFYPDSYDFETFLSDSMKWYSYDADMTELSKSFPDYLFKIYGEGESSLDRWIAYFKNGEMEFCPYEYRIRKPDWNKLGFDPNPYGELTTQDYVWD